MHTHYHCLRECEKPQPFQIVEGGKWFCGKHWHDDRELVECIECTPETCDETGRKERVTLTT